MSRFEKGDIVYLSIVKEGVRIKGVFEVHEGRPSKAGYWEYQLTDQTGEEYHNGEWVREKMLRGDSRGGR